MKPKFFALAIALASSLAGAQDNFPDVPVTEGYRVNLWVIERRLKDLPIPFSFYPPGPRLTWSECEAELVRLVQLAAGVSSLLYVRATEAPPKDEELASRVWWVLGELDNLEQLIVYLRPIGHAFFPDAAIRDGLARSRWQLKNALARLAKPQAGEFPDVPVSHWASNSVNGLRKAGLLNGYPGGTFRGGS